MSIANTLAQISKNSLSYNICLRSATSHLRSFQSPCSIIYGYTYTHTNFSTSVGLAPISNHDNCIYFNPSLTDRTLENWVGRTKLNSIELSNKSVSSHVARIVGTTTPGQKKPFEIVRQSQPYGSVCGERGLFFIGYAAAPDNFEYMLDR